jgi:hypothetical protein
MVEGSGPSLDTAMYIHSGGEKTLVPVRLDQTNVVTEPEPDPEPEPNPEPNPTQSIHFDLQDHADIEMNFASHERPPKNRSFYMREFVARVDGILQALQAREALPSSTKCAECSESVGHWKCDDCIGGQLLCRLCMRHTHFSNPFHRIGCWTGTHFRKAALWEVGVYLTLPHQNGAICPNLVWQKQMLEKVQKIKDKVASNSPEEPKGKDCSATAESAPDFSGTAESAPDPEREAHQDKAAMQFLDQLFAGYNPDDIMEEDDDEDLIKQMFGTQMSEHLVSQTT